MTAECECFLDPLSSTCGEWEGNVSLCICADYGVVAEGNPVPS